MFSYILFDLDGTISDPKIGITTCVQYALESFGIQEPDLDKLEPFIGPPLRDSFMQYYGFTAEQAEAAVEKYRERFRVTGKYENVLYPGMKELLRDLKAAGAHLAVASSKPGVFVEDILRYFEIRDCFEIVVGSELDGTRDKKEEVVEEVLSRFGRIMDERGEGQNRNSVVMIGDRRFDIEGAKAAGMHSIGVAYGYAAPGELQEAGAEIIVKDVEGLRRVLLGYREGAEQTPPKQPDRAKIGPESIFYGKSTAAGDRYRRPKRQSRLQRILKAIGVCVLAAGLYELVAIVCAYIVLFIGMFTDAGMYTSESSYNFWLNLSNSVGTIAGFAACFGIWHKQIRLKPAKRIDKMSLIPMAILAGAVAIGMNGFLTLTQLYRFSPKFQEVSEIQFDIPVWLGLLSYGILAPLGEEVVFRGVIYGQLKKALNVPWAVLLSGLVFGAFHGNLVQFVYASVIGILLAAVYELYGTLWASVAFHGIANLFVYVLLELVPFGGVFVAPVSCVFFLAVSAVSLILMVKWQKNA